MSKASIGEAGHVILIKEYLIEVVKRRIQWTFQLTVVICPNKGNLWVVCCI